MSKANFRRINLIFIFFVFLLSTCSSTPPQPTLVTRAVETSPLAPAINTTPTVYLPLISKPSVVFFGIYNKTYWTAESVPEVMPTLDNAAGKKHASVGWFIDLEDDALTLPVYNLPKNNLYRQLEELWKAGYISFVNLSSRNATALQIANGERDREIAFAAEFYKNWLDLGGNRRAFIAPLQEMNGYWVTYGGDPENYKRAYHRIIDIFEQKGVTRNKVWWVFAPNGWPDVDEDPDNVFENYYPGDERVDFVAFSSYNYGYCPATFGPNFDYGKWETYEDLFAKHIARMQALAPGKKIIIRETASSAWDAIEDPATKEKIRVFDEGKKNQWLIDSYNFFASQPSVIGVYYFNMDEFDVRNCDFNIINYSGYRTGLANPVYQTVTVQQLENLGFR